eukprot:TRINITY_DN7701_c0_g2_i1.p1 TRINITY_DN7701_c0_g2~~TRINITY_DN7701_c0_g2_i1.p1  ORF type:complete len:156 (+),score=17.31 TRINITY_DN7701_c0_g2_i1:730-1197(+)
MEIVLTFPDSGYPDVLFVTTEDSLVKEVVEAGAMEWGVHTAFLEVSFSGVFLPLHTKIVSHGVEGGSLLVVTLMRWIGLDILKSVDMRKRTGALVKKGVFPERTLHLDTPTFTNNVGDLYFAAAWIPEHVLALSFDNFNPLITVIADFFLVHSKN